MKPRPTLADFPDNPPRRDLPAGFRDEDSMFFVPRPLRSFYQCVSVPAAPFDELDAFDAAVGEHLLVLAFAMRWAVDVQNRRPPLPGIG